MQVSRRARTVGSEGFPTPTARPILVWPYLREEWSQAGRSLSIERKCLLLFTNLPHRVLTEGACLGPHAQTWGVGDAR